MYSSRASESAASIPPRAAALAVAIVLLAFTMRGPIVAVSPVVDRIETDLQISSATAGLLTSLPVLCFALGTPLVATIIARAGVAPSVLAALGVLGLGIVVRSADGLPAALVGTVLIGLAITLANVAVPVLIGHRVTRRPDLVLGVYTAALNVGSMLALAATVPLADGFGWRWALAGSALLVGAAALMWWRTVRGPEPADSGPTDPDTATSGPTGPDTAGPGTARPVDARPWWRRPVAWLLTAAFAGQAFSYYSVTAWLPSILADDLGLSAVAAGPAAAVFQVSAVVGALGVPLLLARTGAARVAVLTGACWLSAPLGLLLFPALWPVWCACGGAGQGAGLTLIFALVVRAARDHADNRRTSAAVQGGGYLVAATGPTVLGGLHQTTGGWTVPLLVVVAALLLFSACAVAAARSARQH